MSTEDDLLLSELVSVENVSGLGARVVTGRSWTTGSHVLVKSSSGDLWARARVAYCHGIGRKTFAVGLDFLARTGGWIMRG